MQTAQRDETIHACLTDPASLDDMVFLLSDTDSRLSIWRYETPHKPMFSVSVNLKSNGRTWNFTVCKETLPECLRRAVEEKQQA